MGLKNKLKKLQNLKPKKKAAKEKKARSLSELSVFAYLEDADALKPMADLQQGSDGLDYPVSPPWIHFT